MVTAKGTLDLRLWSNSVGNLVGGRKEEAESLTQGVKRPPRHLAEIHLQPDT